MVLIFILMVATFGVLVAGLLVMSRGKADQRLSNRLMIARVSLQALAIAALLVLGLVLKV
jgi:Hypoxia induced protein conserved region